MFASLGLRVDNKAVDIEMSDLSLWSPPTIMALANATDESRRQILWFAKVEVRVIGMALSAPLLSLHPQQKQTAQQQQLARKAKHIWSPKLLHR
jgi:hypothetical protein